PPTKKLDDRSIDRYFLGYKATIQAQPAYWLWSHRRWKHKPRPGDILSTQFSASQIVSIEAESEEIKGKEGNV
ncbi:MAG: hypothetical protein AAFS00_12700, partial [Bacteroidota bacterium]